MAKENLQVVAVAGARDSQRVLHLKGQLNIQTVFVFQDAMRAETGPALVIDFSDPIDFAQFPRHQLSWRRGALTI